MEVLARFESESTSLPGRVTAVTTVGSLGYAMLRVFEGGSLVRHLEFSDGETDEDRGAALPGEDACVVDEDGVREVDGDLLIQHFTALAGMPGSPEIFDLTGRVYSPSSAAEAGSPDLPAAVPAPQADDRPAAKKGFLRRIVG